jgi:DNA polymerase I
MQSITTADDTWLFGWAQTLGIVSVWADRSGRALVWQRIGTHVTCTEDRFRPWLFAATLEDLAHVGAALREETAQGAERAPFRYRELDGPPESYRYLISARDGRALERAICTGAAQRLGQTVKNLYDVEENYYWVGPVEQYLMATGRVYFRNLAYSDLHRLQFDLETTSLNPQRGRIFLVAVRDSQGLSTTLEAPTPNDEATLIADLCTLIRERNPDVIENHNLFGFDLPFLHERARVLGVPLQMGRPEGPALLDQYEEPQAFRRRKRTRYSIAGRELIDTLDAVWRHDFSARDMPGHGLKAAARYFGVAAPERTYIAGAEIFSTYLRDPDTVRSYALDDVMEVDGISQRLLGSPFALAGMAPRRYERLASAGPAMGILEPMLVRAYLRAGAALPRQSSDSAAFLGNHAGGATHLFAEGVARQVVKADIASMYPSIMRVFQIGPACDYLRVFLYLVDRLTDLRLQHKAAARTATPYSTVAHQHNAVQAAMKILVNSAYGYMGAGAMALFADRPAADEVTRQGREILGQVTDALRERGMALLEADTDGVYFAAPLGWSEEQERRVVNEVGALLPEGIRLEYEGRYKSMLVHEVKNYALLTYNDDLIVRGGALRSSRSEPFGERFLREALYRTLTGDIAGLHRIFVETVNALRERQLTAMEVAIQARLTKTPDEYETSRKRAREASYEALLTAGRTNWHVGERARFYKALDGTVVWIPDTSNDLSGTSDEEDEPDNEQPINIDKPRDNPIDRRDYDVAHYLQVLMTSYVSRLRKAFAPEDFDQLFRPDAQLGLFDRPIETIQPLWIRCEA